MGQSAQKVCVIWEVQGEEQALDPELELDWRAGWPCSLGCLRDRVQEPEQTRCSWCGNDDRCLEQGRRPEIERRYAALDEQAELSSARTGWDGGSYWIVGLRQGHSLA